MPSPLGLENYFTGSIEQLDLFNKLIHEPILSKHLLIIYGIGGIGKSSLLYMYRRYCNNANIPVAMASGDEIKSIVGLLTRWSDDLKNEKIPLPKFSKINKHYQKIMARVNEQIQKAEGRGEYLPSFDTSKSAKSRKEVLSSSIIPIYGTVVGSVIGGMGEMAADGLANWLKGFLNHEEVDLLLDPTKKITDNFLFDISNASKKQRIVLILDSYESLTSLETWLAEVAMRLPQNVFFVIAGRIIPEWDRIWPGWLSIAKIEELRPMNDEAMRHLIYRYHSAISNDVIPSSQVDAIIEFARGLPLVAASTIQIWTKYGIKDFQLVQSEIVANLVDRLLEGIPNSLIPILEAAAVVRWFNLSILSAITGLEDVRNAFYELQKLPFVRAGSEGLVLHDSVRLMIDENLRLYESEKQLELHKRALQYFEKQLENVTGYNATKFVIERLYHQNLIDEEVGIGEFQKIAEEWALLRLVELLRVLLNDVNTYSLKYERSRLWRDYYNARLAQLEGRNSEAENIFSRISENKNADSKLRAYVLFDLGKISSGNTWVNEIGGLEMALPFIGQIKERLKLFDQPERFQTLIKESMSNANDSFELPSNLEDDIKKLRELYLQNLASSVSKLGSLFLQQERWYDALTCFEESRAIHRKIRRDDNNYLDLRALNTYEIARIHHLLGNLDLARINYQDSIRLFTKTQNMSGLSVCKTGMGRLLIQMGYVDDALNELYSAKRIYKELKEEQRSIDTEKIIRLALQIRQKGIP